MADVFRDLAVRLEQRAAEAAELRTRLELTEQTQSTIDAERRRVLEELAAERRRREEAERERDDLRRQLEPPQSPTPSPQAPEGTTPQPERQEAEEPAQRPTGVPWWRRMFGG
jgi:anti-sigma factor RsiW